MVAAIEAELAVVRKVLDKREGQGADDEAEDKSVICVAWEGPPSPPTRSLVTFAGLLPAFEEMA